MDNQHRKIKGYRELTQAEIDTINEIKTKGAELAEIIERVRAADYKAFTEATNAADERPHSEALRWCEIARTHLQQGLMALTRSVAKPDFF